MTNDKKYKKVVEGQGGGMALSYLVIAATIVLSFVIPEQIHKKASLVLAIAACFIFAAANWFFEREVSYVEVKD